MSVRRVCVDVRNHLQSSGERDSACVWAEVLAALPGRPWVLWQRHWGGNHPLRDPTRLQHSASPSGLPVSGCGLVHGTAPPHGGLRAREKDQDRQAKKKEKGMQRDVVSWRVDARDIWTEKWKREWMKWTGRGSRSKVLSDKLLTKAFSFSVPFHWMTSSLSRNKPWPNFKTHFHTKQNADTTERTFWILASHAYGRQRFHQWVN